MKSKKKSAPKSSAVEWQSATASHIQHSNIRHINRRAKKRGFVMPKSDGDSFLVCPIGGIGRIGMNWTAYSVSGKWILVDAGSAFVRDVPGVASIVPDPASFKEIMQDLIGIVITHAHEDHIGGLTMISRHIRCPVYATSFAAILLEGRLKERGEYFRIERFAPGATLALAPFSIETVPITHSTPECVALAITTTAGTIVHTGDWKFDPDPLVGPATDFAALQRIGERGVLAMLGDSTNAQREARTTSESMVARGLANVFARRNGAIAIACFATNVARLAAIGQAAAATGRHVAFSGRSLEKIEAAASAVGLLDESLPFLADIRHLKGLDRRQMVIVVTGTQGEERAALTRLSLGTDWRLPKFGPGDAVIHSARIIPGNEEAIQRVFNRFEDAGVDVLLGAEGDDLLHVTGHATSEEIARMYQILKPRYAVPVHGETEHITAHAEIARHGGSTAIATAEGEILRVSRSGIAVAGQIQVRHLCQLEGEERQLLGWSEKERKVLDSAGRGRRRRLAA